MRRCPGRNLALHARIAAAASALLILLCAGVSAQRAGASARVLVFNIHAGKDASSRGNLEDIAALIRSTGADLVLLQEVDRGTKRSGYVDQLRILGDLTGYSTAFGRSLDYDGGQYGIAALARERISHSTTEPLPIQPPQARAGGSYEPRAALAIATTTPIGAIEAINTHLDSSKEETYRLQESAHIVGMTKRFKRNQLLVAGGDFNMEPSSAAYAQVLAGGLRDAWKECGAGDGLTYPAEKPVKRIDYLFLAAGVRCTRAEVIETNASDHRPLLVTITR